MRAAVRTAGLLVALAALGPSPLASAEPVRLAPSADGYLGAWLASGPLTAAVDSKTLTDATPKRGSVLVDGAPRWRTVAHGAGALDLAKVLDVGPRAGPRAALGGLLELEQRFDGWLLVGLDGSGELFVDGTRRWARDKPHLRGSAWDIVPLALEPGEHRIVVALRHSGEHWAFVARLLDGDTLLPPSGATWILPGTDDGDRDALLSELVRVRADAGLEPAGYRPRLRVEFSRGAPRDTDLDVHASVELGGTRTAAFDVGAVPVGPRGAHALEALLPPMGADTLGSGNAAIRLRVGPKEHRLPLALSPRAVRACARASARIEALARGKVPAIANPETVTATLEHWVARAEQLASSAEHRALETATIRLEAILDRIDAGQNPLHGPPGLVELARASALDGGLEPFDVHVPAGYDHSASVRYPLVVLLHGYGGTPEGIMSAFLGSPSRSAHPRVDGFVVAPRAYGDAFYRGPGETAVIDMIDFMLAHYRIDPHRISVTGVSMGGTGAAHLAFRYSDRFAAAAPLAGYHSYFVRRDIAGKRLRPWEVAQMHHFSPASWAENGRDLFLYVAHGQNDLPLANSRVLTERYKELGYALVEDWPHTGHAVWKVSYANARAWPLLARRARPTAPLRVTLVTDSLRYGKRDWVEVTGIQQPGLLARLDARAETSSRVLVQTEHVEAFTLAREPPLERAGALTVVADGQEVAFAAGAAVELVRRAARWAPGRLEQRGRKKAHLEGPIRDAYLEPLVFVYGSLDPRTTRANREVAEHFASRYGGSAKYPVVADVALTEGQLAGRSLFLVGSSESNALVRDIAPDLPFGTERSTKLGAGQSARRAATANEAGQSARRAATANEAGVIFVYPHPKRSGRYVVVIQAGGAPGIWRALSLPQLLPDFVVYDERLATASAQQVLGDAEVVDAGFFTNDWSLPRATAPGATP